MFTGQQFFSTNSWSTEEWNDKGSDICATINFKNEVFYFISQLATLMFWVEVFMTEWNLRKRNNNDKIRQATVDNLVHLQVTEINTLHLHKCN